ncbi:jasmonoyl--L-amino acid synthetase GH3.3 [Oryza sativa Japonica Group]|uniref:Uncharacterized protein n=2 Tax=Oryza TaxID=4527 RepID=B9EU49_ORYSJ|nr:jasmonic acid-amido synthetase JAR2 isoform X3 [Oryza sativa Japonica Group]XP_052168862.1 jasmonoyl--L-amino acid synthetase GH3.3 [Oryza glaberrima]EEE54131.1 hypothetical protein OsJ_00914 [Oryza sativa Japonica Group]KAF2949115.1 hypothetical protein DAI22_01g084900 [Oryza sativa Japonica Group]
MLEKKATRSTRVDGVSGEAVIEEFERVTRDAANVQRETLRRILAENGGVEYLRGLGLAGATDPATFRARVPLATHADLEPYIDRIADGDASPVLTAKPATSISLSSGTTQGKRKYLLFNEELVKSTMQIYRISYAFRNREFPVENGKALQFIYSSRETRTKGGLTATTATTNVYRSEEFKATMRDIQSQCCSPDEVIFGPDFAQSLYCHLLAGLLAAGDVQIVSATFAHSVVLAFQTFERAWEDLCADIRRGEVSPSRVTSPAVRRAMAALLAAPNPGLADEVARKCAALSNWYGVIPALWPNARYVYGIMTGSMEHYVKKLRHYAGGLPLVAAEYGASEGWVGANVEPGTPPERATFTVLPDIAYFEFIPLKPVAGDGGYAEAEPVGLTEVAAGELYEVVMTTFAGLYRYRLGDVVKVAGFYNATPKLKFVCRRNLMLSINIDKNSEQDLQLAVDAAARAVLAGEKLEVVDYTSHADVSSDPGHYVVFLELNAADPAAVDGDVMQACCDELDRAFADAGYVGSRKSGAIAPLELRVLQRGTFQKVLRHYLSLGAPVSQFKSPRCVSRSNSGVLQILAGCTVNVFFSSAYD